MFSAFSKQEVSSVQEEYRFKRLCRPSTDRTWDVQTSALVTLSLGAKLASTPAHSRHNHLLLLASSGLLILADTSPRLCLHGDYKPLQQNGEKIVIFGEQYISGTWRVGVAQIIGHQPVVEICQHPCC